MLMQWHFGGGKGGGNGGAVEFCGVVVGGATLLWRHVWKNSSRHDAALFGLRFRPCVVTAARKGVVATAQMEGLCWSKRVAADMPQYCSVGVVEVLLGRQQEKRAASEAAAAGAAAMALVQAKGLLAGVPWCWQGVGCREVEWRRWVGQCVVKVVVAGRAAEKWAYC